MTEQHLAIAPAELETITMTLAQLRDRLAAGGELLAATHINHALQCLDPENPLNLQTATGA